MAKLIDLDECERIRRMVLKSITEDPGRTNFWFSFSVDGLGDTDLVVSSGRSSCRQCGEKISKGELAIQGMYDFAQGGAFTASRVQIHLQYCNGGNRGEL